MSVTGNWIVVVKTPLGEQKLKTQLSEEAGKLTGTMDDDRNPAGEIQEATINDGQLRWKFPVKKPFATTLAFSLKLEGDKLTGTCKAGAFPAAVATGSRA